MRFIKRNAPSIIFLWYMNLSLISKKGLQTCLCTIWHSQHLANRPLWASILFRKNWFRIFPWIGRMMNSCEDGFTCLRVHLTYYLVLNQNGFNYFSKPSTETLIPGASQVKRERIAGNAEVKMKQEMPCQRQTKIGIICCDKPWNQVDQKTVSVIYLGIGTEGCKIGNSRKTHLIIDILTTAEFWRSVKDAFI